MRTLRTNRETTPEGFHDEVLSDHITRNRQASKQVNDPQSLPAHAVARVRSGLAPPASTVLRIPLRGTRLRRAVDPGDLCQPSGPDGEGQAKGQARNARGEPLSPASTRRTGVSRVGRHQAKL